jgi:ABC-type multidrug transport system ATPase subunit
MPDAAIGVENLVKRYKRATAVDGISFVVARGVCLALLGSNGSGKTTTLAMLLGARRAVPPRISTHPSHRRRRARPALSGGRYRRISPFAFEIARRRGSLLQSGE